MDYIKIARENLDLVVQELCDWIKIDSVYDESTVKENRPFGKGVYFALEYIASLAEKYGFKVDRCDGYCTEISYGEGEDIIMIMGHADVVPTGENWQYDPFLGEVVDGNIYGRGSEDDKGPTIASFHALKLLKDMNLLNPNKKYVLVVGGNEERGSDCLQYYFNKLHKPHPKYGFTPDASFPLVYGEKGIMTYKYSGTKESKVIKFLDGGIVSNAVVGSAKVHIYGTKNIDKEFNEFINKYELSGKVEYLKDETEIHINGKIAHAAMPYLGKNALAYLLMFLNETFEDELLKHFAPLFSDYHGEKMGISIDGEKMGKLTMNLGLGHYEDSVYSFTLNIRYPIDTTGEYVANILNSKILDKGELISDSKPLYVDPNSEFIKVLMKAYQDISGDYSSKPMTIGGGTYARNTINSVAFGMCFPYEEELAHQVNEVLSIDTLEKGLAIYLEALHLLGNL